MDRLGSRDIYSIILLAKRYIAENREELSRLDSVIGDGDFGTNINRGFELAIERLSTIDPDKTDIGTILMTVANALLESVGGASGPLFGGLFMNMAMTSLGKYEVDLATIANMFNDGLKGVREIGGGTMPGDKTLIDSLYPAVEALQQAVRENRDIVAAFKDALIAAERGAKATANMVAKRGRASYLGVRSIGHQDPGATAIYLIIKAFHDYTSGKR
ncbi:MAG: dihydroxyacetone kinase subunit DhaL [Ignisphaera sp.]